MPAKTNTGGSNPPAANAISASKDKRPPTASKAKVGTGKKKFRKFKGKGEGFPIANQSETRMLAAKTIVQNRPELLGIFDYFPLYENTHAADGGSKAGELFDLRVVLRAADMENINIAFEAIQSEDYYDSALNAYSSAYASALAEFSMLKVVYLMRNIAERAASYSHFQSLYSMPDGVDTSLVGNSVKNYFETQMKFKVSDPDNYWDHGQVPLYQLLYDLCFLSAVASPELLGFHVRKLEKNDFKVTVNTNFGRGMTLASSPGGSFAPTSGAGIRAAGKGGTSGGSQGSEEFTPVGAVPPTAEVLSVLISRDLSASMSLSRVRDEDSAADQDLVKIVEKYLPEGFLSKSKRQIKMNIFKAIAGFDRWPQTRFDRKKFKKERRIKFIAIDQVPREYGLTKSLRDGNILYADNQSMSYPQKTGSDKSFKSMKNVVDSAFDFDTGQLNFAEYKEITENITTHSRDLAIAYKSMFRLLDRSNAEDDEGYTGITVLDGQSPMSPAAIFALCLDVLNRRYAEKLKTALHKNHRTEARQIDYARTQAWVFITKFPEESKKVLKAFFQDFLTGWLTAKAVPAEDEETGKLLDPEYFEPLTGNSASLASKGTSLGGVIGQIRDNLLEGSYKVDNVTISNISVLDTDSDEPPNVVDYSNAVCTAGDINITDKGDMRLNNVWYRIETYETVPTIEPTTEPEIAEKKRYYYVKLVVAEIIDSFLEVIRKITDTVEEVEPVDGDPFFPELTNIKSPYGSASINFADTYFTEMDTEYWVPTAQKFLELFTRSGDQSLLSSGRSLNDFLEQLVDCMHDILDNNFDFLTLKKFRPTKITTTTEPQPDTGAHNSITTKEKLVCIIVLTAIDDNTELLESSITSSEGSSAPDESAAPPPAGSTASTDTPGVPTTANFPPTQQAVSAPLPFGQTMNATSIVNYVNFADNLIRKFLESESNNIGDFSYIRDDTDTISNTKLSKFATYCGGTMATLLEEDQTAGAGFDMLEKYADRVEGFSKTAIAALDGKEGDGELKEYVKALSEASNVGIDILENINPEQLGLKVVTTQRQTGNENESFVPYYSLMNDNVIEGIKILNQNKSLVGAEGLNVRTLLVGLPAGLIESYSLQDGLSLIINNVDLEYNDLVFKPKFYNFDPSIYLLATDIEKTDFSGVNSFKEFVEKINFTKIKFAIDNGSTSDPTMTLDEEDTNEQADEDDIDIFANHTISFLLECYYRIMTGLELNEDTFLSDYNALGLGISSATQNLAGVLASVYSTIDEHGSFFGISTNNIIDDYAAAVEDKVVTPGDFAEIDEEMMSQCRNAMTSRLLSPEQMRDNILAAKMFDRTFMVMVDPDEFVVATRQNCKTEPDSVHYTNFKTIKKYLRKKVIERAGVDDSGNTIYKLAPRRKSEGRMAFNQFFVSVGKLVTNGDDQVEM